MDKLIAVLKTALPVFLALAMGMLCRKKKFLTREGVDALKKVIINLTLPFALFFAIFLPFVMPKIHERYFFLADVLSVLYAVKRPERRFMPLLVVGASFMCYVPYLMRQNPIDERWLSLMMLLALTIVSCDLLAGMKRNRAAFREVKA